MSVMIQREGFSVMFYPWARANFSHGDSNTQSVPGGIYSVPQGLFCSGEDYKLGRRRSSIYFQCFFEGNSNFSGEDQILLMTFTSLKSHANSWVVFGQVLSDAFGSCLRPGVLASHSAAVQCWASKGVLSLSLPVRLSPQGVKDILSAQVLRSTVQQSSLSQPFLVRWKHWVPVWSENTGLGSPLLRGVCSICISSVSACADTLPLKLQTHRLQKSSSHLQKVNQNKQPL